jgi:outer membrane translocation and assembly module TamA
MKLEEKTYQDLMSNEELQQHFLEQYDRLLIRRLKKIGYFEAALIHAEIRKRLASEFELLN